MPSIISASVSHYRPRAVQQTLLPNKATSGCNILIIENCFHTPCYVSLETLKI